MIDHRSNEIVIVEMLKSYLSTEFRPCEVVRQNQVAKVPDYPYVSYSVTTAVAETNGTYSEAEDGTLYRSILQTWSFTIQSDDQDEAMALAIRTHDLFRVVGLTHLSDNGITVRRVRDITIRDNLISIEYEYRKGLDVTFGLLSAIEPGEQPYRGQIVTNKFKEV